MFLLESVFTHEKLAESVQIRSSFQWCELRFVLLLGLNFLILFPMKDPGLILIYPCHLSRAAFTQKQVLVGHGHISLVAVQEVEFGCWFLCFWALLERKQCWEWSKSCNAQGAETPALEGCNWQGHRPALLLEPICYFPRR